MEKYLLVINIGSASKKYALFKNNIEIYSAHFKKNEALLTITSKKNTSSKKIKITPHIYLNGLNYLLSNLKKESFISNYKEIATVGIRIVAPGNYFDHARLIDSHFKRKLKDVLDIAPLHIPNTLYDIEKCNKALPHTKLVAISDSAFHNTLPEHSRLYALPTKTAQCYDIYRTGYHGISLQSIVRKLKKTYSKIPPRIIICHLGGGSSITALKNGKSFDTSMGFSPLEGIPSSTRIGNIDASAIIYLFKKLNISSTQFSKYLNTQCGMLGLSKKTDDFVELLNLDKKRNKDAQLALDIFIYTIKKYIGSYFTVLNGLDLLVFSGSIGENSSSIRYRICQNISSLGIIIDKHKNKSLTGKDCFLEVAKSSVKIAIVTTNEFHEIYLETKNFSK